MTKVTTNKGMKKTTAAHKVKAPPRPYLPRIKLFKPISWYNHAADPHTYIRHLYMEMGRLGLDEHDLSQHQQQVLRNLTSWLSEHPAEQYAALVDWQRLDIGAMTERLKQNPNSKPRIELTAELSKKDNLLVRWYPRGWSEAAYDLSGDSRNYSNLITQMRWPISPDFTWFQGDESATFTSRASNELMFIRSVDVMWCEPREHLSHWTYNHEVVHSILICAVRAAYNALKEQLRYSFEVTVMDDFEFVTQDEPSSGDDGFDFPIHRVVGWKIVPQTVPSLRPSAEVIEMPERK